MISDAETFLDSAAIGIATGLTAKNLEPTELAVAAWTMALALLEGRRDFHTEAANVVRRQAAEHRESRGS